MNTGKLPAVERLMIFFGLISFSLLFYHCIFAFNLHYTFLLWNLLIAFVPYIISKQIVKCKQLNIKAFLLISCWLLFFPGCIYLFTDLMEISKTDNFSFLYDSIMFLSFAFTGLLPGLISLKLMETFLKRHLPDFYTKLYVLLFIFFSSYSVYLVRFLHLKSWNIIADSKKMLYASEHNILNPEDHIHSWLSILALVLLIDIIYFGFKKIYYFKRDNETLFFQ